MKNKKGFVFIELLLVIGIIALLAASTSPFLINFITKNNLETAFNQTVSFVRKAQIYSIENKNNSVWGVCKNGNSLRLYTGSCASPNIKEDYLIPSTVDVSGLTDTTFSKLRGEPSGILTINISSGGSTKSISLNEAGGITLN